MHDATAPTFYLAIDLGAESGRVMLGSLRHDRLTIEELHRFPNVPLKTDAGLHWDVPALFDGVKEGLKQAAALGEPIASVSCDAWGLDYVLLDARDQIIPPAFHYRDARTERGVKTLLGKVPWETVFAETGIQFMPINSAFQLAAESPERLARTTKFLPLGDAFNWMLCGAARAEVSLASTTQLYNPRTRDWSPTLLAAVGLSSAQMPPLVPPGTRLGRLLPELCRETGLGPLEVIATCSHDTGAAVAAVPSETRNTERETRNPSWAYLSSGTWSLMGVELDAPVITNRSRELNFTNEIGFGHSARLLKNISGLWLVQECRRAWTGAGMDFDYGTLTALASAAPAFDALIHPADGRFHAPPDMAAAITEFCRETSQAEPRTPGAFVRCALESLALLYRRTLRQIEELLGSRLDRLHIVGGGGKNNLLNQFAANACGVPVLAGPAEATAIGNILVQAIALGHLPSLTAAREVVRNSTALQRFAPRDTAKWDAAAARFEKFFPK